MNLFLRDYQNIHNNNSNMFMFYLFYHLFIWGSNICHTYQKRTGTRFKTKWDFLLTFYQVEVVVASCSAIARFCLLERQSKLRKTLAWTLLIEWHKKLSEEEPFTTTPGWLVGTWTGWLLVGRLVGWLRRLLLNFLDSNQVSWSRWKRNAHDWGNEIKTKTRLLRTNHNFFGCHFLTCTYT